MKEPKIGILGIGAIGSVISFSLKETVPIFYYNRSNKSQIKLFYNDSLHERNISLSNDNQGIRLDWLIICLKEYHFENAHQTLQQLILSKTKVVVIRNGINLKQSILPYTNQENILECMIDCPTQLSSDGSYHQLRIGKITTKKNKLSYDFSKLFHQRQVQFNQIQDFKSENWKKLIESSALGGILSLSGQTAWIFKDKELIELHNKLVAEGIEVAQAEGAFIDANFTERLVKKLKAYSPNKGSSMLTDRKSHRPIEINAKNGVISSYARKHQIETPLNDMVTLLLRYTNRSF